MIALVPALAGAFISAGILAFWAGVRPVPAHSEPAPSRRRLHHSRRLNKRTQVLLACGVTAGAVVWIITGLPIALILTPLAMVGMPLLLATPPAVAQIARLEAMEEWTRALSGVLTVGVGLEQALSATLRSTPAPIADEVERLVARLRARWVTEEAIRAFAEDLNDPTGDLVAANLILGARRRGAGLANVLEGLAESVAADVKARRQVEADRAKPRATARWVTIISASVLVLLALTGTYVEPYSSPFGQALLTALLAAYIGTLVWMRQMALGRPNARFLTLDDTRSR